MSEIITDEEKQRVKKLVCDFIDELDKYGTIKIETGNPADEYGKYNHL